MDFQDSAAGPDPLAPTPAPADSQQSAIDEPSEARQALVKEWLGKIAKAEKHWRRKVFRQMKTNQFLAKKGATKSWIEQKKYTVAIINRHINVSVAALYARDPVPVAKPREKLWYTLWDGRADTLNAALQQASMGDPNASAIINEIEQVRQQQQMLAKMGKTVELLFKYFTAEQDTGFRMQMKALVRRSKVCGVAYVKLAFQRVLEERPEYQSQLEDSTTQLAAVERLMAAQQGEEFDASSARAEELRLLVQQIQDKQYLVVREGPVFDFPRADKVIIDPACTHLKSLMGANWLATEFNFTADKIKEIYKVDVKGKALISPSKGDSEPTQADSEGFAPTNDTKPQVDTYTVYEIQDKNNGQFATVCVGYNDFLKEPAEPEVCIERFYTIFPLVFNETEDDENVYPPSDVEQLTDTQMEFNSVRQGLREHRLANRPRYVARAGMFSEEEKSRFARSAAHELIELMSLQPDAKIADLFQRLPMVGIDPNQYDVAQMLADMERVVGSQAADIGESNDATATNSSIAEQGRMKSLSENTDDLDEMLSSVAKASGELMLLQMSKQMVMEIVGPGAVWPDAPPTRQETSRDLLLEIKAGSSGRPNAAAELANMERALPFLLQIPGVPPGPLRDKMLGLLNIDVEGDLADGMPSITALNAVMANQQNGPPAQPQVQQGPTPQAAQGPQGALHAPAPPAPQGPQPGMPAPGPGPHLLTGAPQ